MMVQYNADIYDKNSANSANDEPIEINDNYLSDPKRVKLLRLRKALGDNNFAKM